MLIVMGVCCCCLVFLRVFFFLFFFFLRVVLCDGFSLACSDTLFVSSATGGAVNVVDLRPSVRGELVEPPADRPFDKLRANGDMLKSTVLGGAVIDVVHVSVGAVGGPVATEDSSAGSVFVCAYGTGCGCGAA